MDKRRVEKVIIGDKEVVPTYISSEVGSREQPWIEFNLLTKFRYHRGGLAESMDTLLLVSSKSQLKELICDNIGIVNKDAYKIEIEFYGYDIRIKWKTYAVSMIAPNGGKMIVGFTDGPLLD